MKGAQDEYVGEREVGGPSSLHRLGWCDTRTEKNLEMEL